MTRSTDGQVVVVGGGVIGVCCVYFLAKRGARVTVLVYVAPRLDPALAKWLWFFSQKCSEEHFEYSMQALAPLGYASRALFNELIQTEDLRCWFCPGGYYEIYLTERGLQSAIKESRMLSRFGSHPELLSGVQLRERDSAIKQDVVGGIFYPEAATINPCQFVRDLASKTLRHGAKFQTAAEVVALRIVDGHVRGVQLQNGEFIKADTVVLATGAYSARLLHQLGLRFPLQAAKGYHRDCEAKEGGAPLLTHACVLGENMVFCSPMDGFVRFAGTLELSGVNHNIRRPRLEQLTRAAIRYLKTMEDAVVKSDWCGLRPCLPDGLPAIGPVSRYPGLFVASGHAMMGLTLGPVTGKLISECVLDDSPSIDIASLRPDRF